MVVDVIDFNGLGGVMRKEKGGIEGGSVRLVFFVCVCVLYLGFGCVIFGLKRFLSGGVCVCCDLFEFFFIF